MGNSKMVWVMWAFSICLAACDPSEQLETDGGADTDSDADTDADADTDTDIDTDADTDTDTDTNVDGGTADCAALPTEPLSVEDVVGPFGFHDLAFDDLGYMYGAELSGTLFKFTSDGIGTMFVSGISAGEGMDLLPSGELAVATSDSGIVAVSTDGEVRIVNASLIGDGLTVGPDGMIYVAGFDDVYRIDPVSGETSGLEIGCMPMGVDFSPNHHRVYVACFHDTGDAGADAPIRALDLDDEMNPAGDPYVFALIPEGGYPLDGIGVDACGNIFVISYERQALYRITAAGEVAVFYQWNGYEDYGHGLKWGSGVGGWDDESLYMPKPYDAMQQAVVKMDIGVRHRP